jgi:HK97 family phage prohead protease
MSMQRFYTGAAAVEMLGDLDFGGVAADGKLALDGNIVPMDGLDFTNYRDRNSILLEGHNPSHPVGTVTAIGVVGDQLLIRGRFAEPGISPIADQTRALLKAAILKGLSIGFDVDPTAAEPIDKAKPRGGMRFKKTTLLEISIVAVPASPGALVTARSAASRAEFIRAIGALPATPQAALTRAAAQFSKRSDGRPPSPTITTWALLEARKLDEEEREKRLSYPARQRELERLRMVGRRNSN